MSNINYDYITPKYYKEFKCKSINCRRNCCHGWNIFISDKEIQTIKENGCSKDIQERIDKAFSIENKDQISQVVFDSKGYCPLLKDGLCLVHKELGEECLPIICKTYPRQSVEVNGKCYAVCTTSCEKVVEILYDMDSFETEVIASCQKPMIKYEISNNNGLNINKYIELLNNDEIPLVECIKKICIEQNADKYKEQILSTASPIMTSIYLLNQHTCNVKDDYMKNILNIINKRYIDDYSIFENDKKEFVDRFSNYERFFRNLLINSLIKNSFPRTDIRNINTYNGLCSCYGLMMLVAVGYTSLYNTKEDLIDAMACLFRIIDHGNFYSVSKNLCGFCPILLDI